MKKQMTENFTVSGKSRYFKQKIAIWITLAVLILAMIAVGIIMGVSSIPILSNHDGKMSNPVFILLMSGAFLLLASIPFVVEKILRITISPAIILVYIIQCFGGTFLGNVANLYWVIPFYNKAIHFLLGLNLSMVALAAIQFFNRKNGGALDPLFTAAMVLFTGIALCTFWEVFEFLADLMFDMNMQGYFSHDAGEPFVGREALFDTMVDFLLDIAGTAVVAIPTYFSIKYNKNWHKSCEIKGKSRVKTESLPPEELAA